MQILNIRSRDSSSENIQIYNFRPIHTTEAEETRRVDNKKISKKAISM